MLDYAIITVSKYDGNGGKTQAVEVFNTVTGTTIAIRRRQWGEAKAAWIRRAMNDARMEIA